MAGARARQGRPPGSEGRGPSGPRGEEILRGQPPRLVHGLGRFIVPNHPPASAEAPGGPARAGWRSRRPNERVREPNSQKAELDPTHASLGRRLSLAQPCTPCAGHGSRSGAGQRVGVRWALRLSSYPWQSLAATPPLCPPVASGRWQCFLGGPGLGCLGSALGVGQDAGSWGGARVEG